MLVSSYQVVMSLLWVLMYCGKINWGDWDSVKDNLRLSFTAKLDSVDKILLLLTSDLKQAIKCLECVWVSGIVKYQQDATRQDNMHRHVIPPFSLIPAVCQTALWMSCFICVTFGNDFYLKIFSNTFIADKYQWIFTQRNSSKNVKAKLYIFIS